MAYFLGIDGGGTGCRAVLADAGGRILGTARAGPANIVTDPEGARNAIVSVAREACAAAGVVPEATTAVLGLAGANFAGAADALRAALPFAARIVSDAVTAMAGAFHATDGVAAILGTGSVFARQAGGRIATLGGWGLNVGDEASGAWIGRAALTRALHAHDGLAVMTPLSRALLQDHGGPAGIAAFAALARPVDFAALAPRVLTALPDPAASAIVAAAADWIARAIGRLDHGRPEPDLPVCMLGGLGPALTPHLPPALTERLTAPRGTSAEGAVWLARQGAPDV